AVLHSGVTDLTGNPLASDVTWTFTTATPVVCPCSIWTPDTVPTFLINNAEDSRAVTEGVELGVRFRSDLAGTITGIRFYKNATDTSQHLVSLWDPSGGTTVPVATAISTANVDTGWQEVHFTTPVSITANHTYMASYHTNVGRYPLNRTYFLPAFTSSFTRAP